MDCLYRRNEYADAPRSGPILPDLDLPRKNSGEALDESRDDQDHHRTPVIGLTNSKAHEEIDVPTGFPDLEQLTTDDGPRPIVDGM